MFGEIMEKKYLKLFCQLGQRVSFLNSDNFILMVY